MATEAEYEFAQLSQSLASQAPAQQQPFLERGLVANLLTARECLWKVHAYWTYFSQTLPAAAERFQRHWNLTHEQELEECLAFVQRRVDRLDAKKRSVCSKWPGWDWKIVGWKKIGGEDDESNWTPPSYSERMLDLLVAISRRTPAWQQVVRELAVVVERRLEQPQRYGRRVAYLQPQDLEEVKKKHPDPRLVGDGAAKAGKSAVASTSTMASQRASALQPPRRTPSHMASASQQQSPPPPSPPPPPPSPPPQPSASQSAANSSPPSIEFGRAASPGNNRHSLGSDLLEGLLGWTESSTQTQLAAQEVPPPPLLLPPEAENDGDDGDDDDDDDEDDSPPSPKRRRGPNRSIAEELAAVLSRARARDARLAGSRSQAARAAAVERLREADDFAASIFDQMPERYFER